MSIWANGVRTTLDKPEGVTDCYIFFEPKQVQHIPKASTFGISFYAKGLDYWIDCGGRSSTWNKALDDDKVIKIFRKIYFKTKLSKFSNTYFLDLWCLSKGIEGMFHLNQENPHFLWVGTSIGVLLNLIVFMGYKRIHIVNGNFDGYENYGSKLFLCEFADIAKNYGVDCFSCINVSSLNTAMEFKPLEQAIKDTYHT